MFLSFCYSYLFQICCTKMSALHKVRMCSLCFIKKGTRTVSCDKVSAFTAPFSSATKRARNRRHCSSHWKRIWIKQETILAGCKQCLVVLMVGACDRHHRQYWDTSPNIKFLLTRKWITNQGNDKPSLSLSYISRPLRVGILCNRDVCGRLL